MLNEGLTLMAVGMGTVFSFLVILWLVVSILCKVVMYLNKLFPEVNTASATTVKKVCDNVEVAIAIAAAKLRK